MSHDGTSDSRASAVRPLLEGDLFDGRRVIGFAWKSPGPGLRSTHLDDRLLLEGDERLLEPPDRPVPLYADGAAAVAPMPPDDLGADHRPHADTIDRTIALRAQALLDLTGTPWQPLARSLLAAIHASGHRVWFVGGSVRDLVRGVPLRHVNDLDLSGTAPPGRFSDILYQTMRSAQMSEYRTTVSKDSLVCAVVPERIKSGQSESDSRLLEYRGLNRGGFAFPAVGSRLEEDARHRDFSFNSLLYDALDDLILDPSGHGLPDLTDDEYRFRPLGATDGPVAAGAVIVRAMKFAIRWRAQARLELFFAWVRGLPTDLFARLSDDQLDLLVKIMNKDHDATADQRRRFAMDVPEPGRSLLQRVIGRVR